MRSIAQTQEEQDRKKRNIQIFCFGLLALMLFSTVGYAFFSNPNAGISGPQSNVDTGLRQVGERWIFGPADKPISLAYSPEETQNTSIETVLGIENYVAEPLFIDSENQGVTAELGGVFQYYASRMQEACYGQCERDLPEKDCTNNVIVFRDSEENAVRQENKCLFIEGDLRTVDAYIYSLFGISSS